MFKKINFKTIINAVLPETCIVCKQESDTVCYNCRHYIKPVGSLTHCIVCENMTTNYTTHKKCLNDYKYVPIKLYYDFLYNNITKLCITKAKSTRKHTKSLNYLLEKSICIDKLKNYNIDVIVPIPSSTGLFSKNQSQNTKVIAEYFSNALKLPVLNCLGKCFTSKQSKTEKQYRFKNANSSILFDVYYADHIKDRNVLLVDDVITTGATMLASSKLIHKHKAKSIYAYALAYDVKLS